MKMKKIYILYNIVYKPGAIWLYNVVYVRWFTRPLGKLGSCYDCIINFCNLFIFKGPKSAFKGFNIFSNFNENLPKEPNLSGVLTFSMFRNVIVSS